MTTGIAGGKRRSKMEDRESRIASITSARAIFTRASRKRRLEFIFFERLERGGAGAERVVFGHAVEDVHAAVVQQGGLGDRALGRGGADLAAAQRLVGDFLQRFEAVSPGAFVFVKRHERFSCYHIDIAASTRRELAAEKNSWYKISCLLVNNSRVRKTQAQVWVFF